MNRHERSKGDLKRNNVRTRHHDIEKDEEDGAEKSWKHTILRVVDQ
jgi:hypothetical protein